MRTTRQLGVVRTASICFIIAFLLTACFLGREILFPLLMAMLFAVLLRPMVSFMNKRLRFPHVIAVLIAVSFGLSVTLAVIYFLSIQIGGFMNDLPALKRNISLHLSHIQGWIHDQFKVPVKEQDRYFDSMVNPKRMITSGSITSLTGPILNAILIPIYTFLILIYRALFLRFLIRVTPNEHHARLAEIVFEIKSVVRSYILGLLLEMAIVSALTAVGFWIVGVEYFIFLGLLTGILNLIPYIGIIVALVVSMLVAMVSSPDIAPVIGVLLVNIIVQFIDNNILMPRVVGSKVSINALASMVAVIVGGHLAGVAGMFLALPVVAIVKVIFDRIETTNAIGYLMGDNIPKTFSWRSIRFPDLNAGGHEEKDEENREIL